MRRLLHLLHCLFLVGTARKQLDAQVRQHFLHQQCVLINLVGQFPGRQRDHDLRFVRHGIDHLHDRNQIGVCLAGSGLRDRNHVLAGGSVFQYFFLYLCKFIKAVELDELSGCFFQILIHTHLF